MVKEYQAADIDAVCVEEIAERLAGEEIHRRVSLTGQPFVMEPSKIVGQLLKEHNAEVIGLIRFEAGEGIEKVDRLCSSCCDVQAVLSFERCLRAVSSLS